MPFCSCHCRYTVPEYSSLTSSLCCCCDVPWLLLRCTRVIKGPVGTTINFKFNLFQLSPSDYFSVYRGASTSTIEKRLLYYSTSSSSLPRQGQVEKLSSNSIVLTWSAVSYTRSSTARRRGFEFEYSFVCTIPGTANLLVTPSS